MYEKQFNSPKASHEHSLETLNMLYDYDDFMLSIDTLLDAGCGLGLDLEWWATRTTREESPEPLNIKCTGWDSYHQKIPIATKYQNITYMQQNFETPTRPERYSYDVIWCHDAFQYAINPIGTLRNFYHMLSPGGMLALCLPQSTNIEFHKQEYNQFDGVFYNHTLVSLIHMLAVNGFDCKNGFFKKLPDDPWLNVVVYKSDIEPMDSLTTRWYDLAEAGLLPVSAETGINKVGHLRQRDLVLPWLNRSNIDYSRY